KLARMALRLQEYQPFEIVHIPGKENNEADYLSRLVGAITLDYSQPDDIFHRKQRCPTDFVSDEKGRFRFVGDGKDRLAIPRKHRHDILKALHDDHGHLSLDRVLDLARNRFFWPEMTKDIKAHIQACHNCSVGKDVPIKKAEMKPTTDDVSGPFERWHVDVIENITMVSSKGNRFILVAQDAFSKWPEALAVPTCTTKVITDW